MYMIGLDVHCSNGPGILSTDATNLLFKKRGNLANENLFPVFGTPDKMVGQLIRGVFGVLRIHTRHYNTCSNSLEGPRWAALPLDES